MKRKKIRRSSQKWESVKTTDGDESSTTSLRMGGRQEAFDAEPMALRAGLQLIAERREEGASYTVFTDSQRRSKPGGFRDTAGRDHPLEGVHSEH